MASAVGLRVLEKSSFGALCGKPLRIFQKWVSKERGGLEAYGSGCIGGCFNSPTKLYSLMVPSGSSTRTIGGCISTPSSL